MQRSLKIGIDARLITYRRGMGNFTYNLLVELAKLSTPHNYILYVDDPNAIQAVPACPRYTVKVLQPKFYPVWEQTVLPRQVQKDQLDLLHCPANTAPLKFLPNTKLLLTIHDVMYLMPLKTLPLSPSWYQRLGRLYRRLVVPYVARRAALITTVSEQSRRDIVAYLGNLSAPLVVVPEAASSTFQRLPEQRLLQIKATYALTQKVILALGGVDPRKNTRRVLEAFAQFQAQAPKSYQLLLVGLSPMVQAEYGELARKLGIENALVMTDFIPEADLVALYNVADMFLYPSLYEGFGLPVLEAMACGAPVISANRTAIPELAGDAALLIDPLDTAMLTNAMRQLAEDEPFRQTLITRGLAQSKKFSWANAARATLALYEEVGAQ